jgi:hypothetical protein
MAKMSILIKNDPTVKVEFWACEHKETFFAWDTEEEMKNSEAFKENPDDILHIEAFFREPNYKDMTHLTDRSFEANQDGSFSFNLNAIRMERVWLLLSSWNLKDSDGKNIPANRENVEKMHPPLAFYLAGVLEKQLGLTETE